MVLCTAFRNVFGVTFFRTFENSGLIRAGYLLKYLVMNQDNTPLKSDNTVKDPATWTTGAQPMTGAQASYLKTLASEAGEEPQEDLTKAEASQKIDELQHKTGRGEE